MSSTDFHDPRQFHGGRDAGGCGSAGEDAISEWRTYRDDDGQKRKSGLPRCFLCSCTRRYYSPALLRPTTRSARTGTFPMCHPRALISSTLKGTSILRPFIYPWVSRPESLYEYEESRDREYPIHFFVKGPEYKVAGFLSVAHSLVRRGSASADLSCGQRQLRAGPVFKDLVRWPHIIGCGFVGHTDFTFARACCLAPFLASMGDGSTNQLMRTAELFLVLPWLYMLLAVRAFLPLHISPTQTFFLLVAVIGSVGWARPARLVRGVVLSAKNS